MQGETGNYLSKKNERTRVGAKCCDGCPWYYVYAEERRKEAHEAKPSRAEAKRQALSARKKEPEE